MAAAVLPLIIGLVGSGVASAIGSKSAKANQMGAQTPTAAQTVTAGDPAVSANAAGRAALISTNPQGVLGTETTGRRRLLGN